MSHSENDKLIDDLMDREVKKPEKKSTKFFAEGTGLKVTKIATKPLFFERLFIWKITR